MCATRGFGKLGFMFSVYAPLTKVFCYSFIGFSLKKPCSSVTKVNGSGKDPI
jgi:hypothetical protein